MVLGHIFVRDVVSWLALFLVILVSSSLAMYVLHLRPIAGLDGERDFLSCLRPNAFHAAEFDMEAEWYLGSFFEFALVGDAPFACAVDSAHPRMATGLVTMMQFIIAVILVNLLIAQMGKTFDGIYEAQAMNSKFLFFETVRSFEEAHVLPPPFNIAETLMKAFVKVFDENPGQEPTAEGHTGDRSPPRNKRKGPQNMIDFQAKTSHYIYHYIVNNEGDVAQEDGHRTRRRPQHSRRRRRRRRRQSPRSRRSRSRRPSHMYTHTAQILALMASHVHSHCMMV